MVDYIIKYVSMLLALMVVLPFHEFGHAFAAVKSGDPTPKLYNRYTVNPFAHFDMVGLACFAFLGFGWARPVPVNPGNFRNYKRGCFWVSISGVLVNYLIAFSAFPLYVLTFEYVPQFGYFTEVLLLTLRYMFTFSLSFFVFNLLPFYPLDGFRVVDVFSKQRGRVYYFLRVYGVYVLYGLIFLGILADFTNISQLDILGNIMSTLVNYISMPIIKFWGLIF